MKAKKIVICDEYTQVYPADVHEDIWHIWHDGKPIAEIQFASGPMDVGADSDAVIQDYFDYIILDPPSGHEQVFEDRRTKEDR